MITHFSQLIQKKIKKISATVSGKDEEIEVLAKKWFSYFRKWACVFMKQVYQLFRYFLPLCSLLKGWPTNPGRP